MKLLLGLWSLSHLLLSSSGDEEPAGTSKGNVFQVTDAFANNGFFSLRFYGCIAVFNKSLNFQEAILVCGNQQPWANDDNELREQTRDREAPWLVNIVGNGQQCQGAVLNNWWILTAASCFLRMKPSSVELIMAGGYPFTITVSQYLSHRGFSSWARPPSNDLGLVMLGQPIDLRKREMWPICLPDRQESSLTRAQCRIYKREQDDSKQWLERIAVYFLEMSECTAEWPGTSERWNLCMAREVDNETDCKVPVGSPVLCHNLNSDHWELRGIVSQGLTNCTHPVLATQVVPHLEWLWQEGLLKDPVPPTMGYTETTGSSMPSLAEEGSSETAPQLQDVFPTQEESEASPTEQPLETAIPAFSRTPMITSQPPALGLQAPVIIPPERQMFGITPRAAKVIKHTTAGHPVSAGVKKARSKVVTHTTARHSVSAGVKKARSKVVTHTTAGHSVSVNSSTVQWSPPATEPTVFVIYPTTKRSSPVRSPKTKAPTTPGRRKSRPQISTPRVAKIIITAHSRVTKPRKTRQTRASTKAHLTTSKRTYVIPSKKHLPNKTRTPPPEQSATTGQSSASVRPMSSVASPTTKQTPVTPTTSHSSLAALTVVHAQHKVIIPATTRPSPASKKVPPADAPSLRPPAAMSAAGPFIAAGPHFPKNKFEETLTPGPPLAFLASPSPAVPTTPRLVSRAHMTMEQCEMGLAWNSVSRTYQLNKVADLMERKIGCGLRPGFVPHCPSCSEAEVGEFPWVVSLTLSIQHFCAGSILNPWWILTTANCANLIKNSAALVLVQAGLVDISEGTGSVHIRQALTYPDVLASEDLHNLGLLQLQKPLEFGPLIAPMCLSDTAHAIEDFRNCWLPSWTVLQGGPARLLRRPLASLNISSCNRLEENLSKAIFCITAQKDQEGICKGDLGSPLICPDPKGGAWVQLGVLSSFDEACSRPYVFNSLHPYLPWLEETTKAAGYRDNYTVSWQRQGPALQLRTLQKPEALVKRISAHLSLPWQAFVATCRKRSCGGSILNHYWVLTTARCVQDTKPENIAVFVGLKHPKGHARGILVAGIYPYEGIPWSNVSAGNVALLLLQESVAFGKYATRMTLPLTDTWDSCKVTGLQTLKPGEAEPDPAAYQAKVVQASDCARKHPRVNPSMYCVIRNDNHSLPVATMPEGAGLLCRLEAKRNPWSQVGLTSEPFPGSQPDILASSIVAYKDWIKETSKEARRHFLQSRGRTAHGPSWSLLLIPSLFGVTALG